MLGVAEQSASPSAGAPDGPAGGSVRAFRLAVVVCGVWCGEAARLGGRRHHWEDTQRRPRPLLALLEKAAYGRSPFMAFARGLPHPTLIKFTLWHISWNADSRVTVAPPLCLYIYFTLSL